MNPKLLSSAPTNYNAVLPANAPPQAQSQSVQPHQASQPNFFEKLLPTAGSILGGVVGIPLNALDAVTGVGGTALDAGAAAAGGAAGKALENLLTHQNVGSGVGTSALEGGIGQAGGEALGAAGKGVLGMLGRGADTGATRLIQGQFANGTMDAGTAGTLNDMGITNAKQVGDIYPHTVALNKGVQRGFEEAGTSADLSNLSTTARNLVAHNQMQLNPGQAAKAGSISDIDKTVQSALLGAINPEDVTTATTKGSAPAVNVFAPGALKNVLPENAFKVTQNFESLANNAYKGAYDKMGNVNPDQLAKYNIFKGLAEESRKAAFGGDTPIPLSDANKAQIVSDLAPMKDVNPSAYNWHVGQVSNASNLQDLRPIQAPLVKANQALNTSQKLADVKSGMTAADVGKMAAPIAGSVAGGPAGLAGGLAVSALGSKAADRMGAGLLSRVSDVLTNPAMQKFVQQSAPIATDAIANLPNDITQPQQGGNSMSPTAPMAGGAGGTQPNGVSPTASPILQLVQELMGNLQNVQSNPAMTGASQFASSDTSALQSLVPTLQKASVANAALQSLMQEYGQAGGGQGAPGGLLNEIGQTLTGGPASLTNNSGFNAQAGQLNQQLQGLGISSPLPSLTQTAPAAVSSANVLQTILNAMGGGGGSLLGTVPTATTQ